MAGGIGSRFWPLSTPELPKQFVDIMGTGQSMIQMTVERFLPICPIENIWVVTGEKYANIIKEQLPMIPEDNILKEPAARNTAPCIAYACWKIRKKHKNANIVVTPSDAYIENNDEFRRVITKALEFTIEGKNIVTVGIKPTRPETGYGYIETGSPVETMAIEASEIEASEHRTSEVGTSEVIKVKSFREKPDLATAKQYLAAGNYLWNAGIFVWNVDTITDSIREYDPELAEIMDQMEPDLYTEREVDTVGKLFPTCPKISIDYAVMEKSPYIYTIPGDFGWSDVGTWGSLRERLTQDENGNAIVGEHIHLNDCSGCIVHAPAAQSLVIQGLKDCIVAEKNGQILICSLAEEQNIKNFEK